MNRRPNIQMEPTRQAVRATMPQRRAAHLERWADEYERLRAVFKTPGFVGRKGARAR